jgi:signal transduction histidine kinase
VLQHLAPVEREVEADTGKWYLLRMLPYRSAPHGLGGVAITLVDITTRKKAELELREADRRKDEFIALLAHELRNPLAPISSGIEILRRRDLDRSVREGHADDVAPGGAARAPHRRSARRLADQERQASTAQESRQALGHRS